MTAVICELGVWRHESEAIEWAREVRRAVA